MKVFFIYENQNKFGFKNSSLNIVIENKYEDVKEFIDSFTWVKKDSKWFLIDVHQKNLLKNKFDNVCFFENNYSIAKEKNQFYLIDNHNHNAKKINYEVIDFSENLFLVKENKNYFFLDINLKKVNNVKYENCLKFIDGFAPVAYKSKWGIINKFGKTVVDFQYDDMKLNGSNLFKVQKDSKTYFIDLHNNKYLETLTNKYLIDDYFSSDVIIFQHKNKVGVMNDFFEVLFLKRIEKIFPYDESYAIYLNNNKYGIISKKGRKITSNIFDKVLWKNENHYFVIKDQKYNYFSLEDKKLIY